MMRIKRNLAVILSIAMLAGNTVPAFATEGAGGVPDPSGDTVQTEETGSEEPSLEDEAFSEESEPTSADAGEEVSTGDPETPSDQDTDGENGESGDEPGDVNFAGGAGDDEEPEDTVSEDQAESETDWSIYDDRPSGYVGMPDFFHVENPDLNADSAGRRRYNGEEYPAKYITPDMPDLRDQGDYGLCWAFATIAQAEINLAKQGLTEAPEDLSELQLAYFTFHSVTDPLGGTEGDIRSRGTDGSIRTLDSCNSVIAATILNTWTGAVPENELSYSEAKSIDEKEKGNPDYADYMYPDPELAYEKDRAHLTQASLVAIDPQKDLDPVKKLIYDNGAVAAVMITGSEYYDDKYTSFYCPVSGAADHAVTLVGWDDDFPKEHFNTKTGGAQPEANGAWLVRNSWRDGGDIDNGWGYDGYFWISYYSGGLDDTPAVSSVYDLSDNYDFNYQYDGSLFSRTDDGISTAANVFTVSANEGGSEKLHAVSFETFDPNVDYTIKIYTNLENPDDPTSGTFAFEDPLTGTADYQGYHTIKLDTPVPLDEGSKFSVVLSYTKDGKPYGVSFEEPEFSSENYYSKSHAEPGQSFALGSDGKWSDFGKERDSNFCIKAYTDKAEAVNVTSITFDEDSIELSVGETKQVLPVIEPDSVSARNLTWTISDNGVAEVSNTGVVRGIKAGESTITASCNGISDSFKVTVKSDLKAISIQGKSSIAVSEKEYQYKIRTTPADVSGNAVWTSGNEEILTVSEDGTVTPKLTGTVSINASLEGVEASREIFVRAETPIVNVNRYGSSLVFSWDEAEGAERYELWRQEYPDGTLEKTATVSSDGIGPYSIEDHVDVEGDYMYELRSVYTDHGNGGEKWETEVFWGRNPAAAIEVQGFDAAGNKKLDKYVSKFDEAVKDLKNENGVRYEIKLLQDAALDSNVTIPAFVTNLTLTTSENSTAALDFAGHTLSYSPTVGGSSIWLSGGLQLRSTGGKGSIKATAARNNILNIVANPDIVSAEAAQHYIDNVDFIAGGQGTAYVDLKTKIVQDPLDLGPVYHINGDINATLFKVNLGRFKVNNVTAKDAASFGKGEGISSNYLEMNNAVISGTGLRISGTELKASKLTVNSGDVEIKKTATADIGTFEMKGNGKFTNDGDVKIDTVSTIVKLDNKPGAYFEAGKYNMASTGALYLEPGSKFHVNENAIINNLFLGQDASGKAPESTVSANITRLEDTTITINGKLQAKRANDMLFVTTVDPADRSTPVETAGQTTLFTTNIKSFPLDKVRLCQPAGSPYTELFQMDTAIVVASRWIDIYSGDELLQSFSKWSDAVAYLNTINNDSADYTVVLKDDVITNGALAFPSKAKSFTLKGNNAAHPGDPVTIKYTGNITPTVNTVFENLILVPGTYDKTAGFKPNPNSTINLNGRSMTWKDTWSDSTFATITGSGASALNLVSTGEKRTLTVNKGITAPNLSIENYKLVSVKDSLTSATETWLKSAEIDVKSNITFRNLHTLNKDNRLWYASVQNNTFKINGTVDSVDQNGEDHSENVKDVVVRGRDNNGTTEKAEINLNAVEIHVKYIENEPLINSTGTDITDSENPGKNYYYKNYKNDRGKWVVSIDNPQRDLVYSAKAAASYFVIGKNIVKDGEEYNGSIQYALKKVGNAIRVIKDSNKCVELHRKTADGEILGYYRYIQDALDDIDRFAVKTEEYVIKNNGDFSDLTCPQGKNLIMPKQAAKVTITSGLANPWRLRLMDTLTLNTNLVIENAELLDDNGDFAKTLNINLNSYSLTLKDVKLERKIGKITGNGTGKTSGLEIINSGNNQNQIIVNGDIVNVANLTLQCKETRVYGNINVGNIEAVNYSGSNNSTLTGTVKSITVKNGVNTAVASNITIAGKVTGDRLVINLLNKDKATGQYKALTSGEFTGDILTDGSFVFATGSNVDPEMAGFGWSVGNNANGTTIKRNGNLAYITTQKSNLPYLLRYKENTDDEEYVVNYCLSFADAVTEINKLGIKRDYTIALNLNSNKKSLTKAEAPDILTMPQAKNIASLTVRSADTVENERTKADDELHNPYNEDIKLYYTGNAITLTSPTRFENVNLIREKQNKDKTWSIENGTGTDDYLTATAVKTSGYDVTYSGTTVFDTPLTLDGGKNGALILEDEANLYTGIDKADELTGDSTYGANGAFINGSVTNFAAINLGRDQELYVKGFKTGNATTESYVVPTLTATNVDIKGGRIEVGEFMGELTTKGNTATVYHPLDKTTAQAVITNLTVKGHGNTSPADFTNETVTIHGRLAVTNLTLAKNDEGTDVKTVISADRDFSIGNKGTVVCGTSDAVLATRRNAKSVPFLTIPGTVELASPDCRIGVAVRDSVENLQKECGDTPPAMSKVKRTVDLPDTESRQLLTASSAKADLFAVETDPEFAEDADYEFDKFLVRNGNNILVYDKATECRITVAASPDEGSYLDRETTGQIIDDELSYYPTWKQAVDAINAYNRTDRYYTIIINQPIGVKYGADDDFFPEPIALTMPSKAKRLYVTASDDEWNYIYYTGNITVNCPAELKGIDLNPLASVKVVNKVNTVNGGKNSITANANELVLSDITVGKAFEALDVTDPAKNKAGEPGIQNISSTTGNIILDSAYLAPAGEEYVIFGDITSSKGEIEARKKAKTSGKITADTIAVDEDVTLEAGKNGVTATTLKLRGNAELKDIDAAGKITITDIRNFGTGQNKITYGRTAKNASNLEIKGTVAKDGLNPNPYLLILDMVKKGGNTNLTAAEMNEYVLSATTDMTKDKNDLISNPKINLTDAKRLFTAPKLTSDKISARIGGTEFDDGGTVAKGINAFWCVTDSPDAKGTNTTKVSAQIQSKPSVVRTRIDPDAADANDMSNGKATIKDNLVVLTGRAEGYPFTGYYLDWNQAVAEINALNDPREEYSIAVGASGIYDTNMTDGNWRSALTMPGANKVKKLTIAGASGATVRFSGAVTTYGNVLIKDLVLNSQDNKGQAEADLNITMNSDRTASNNNKAGIAFENVKTFADNETWDWEGNVFNGTRIANEAGYIGKISGSKNKTENLTVINSNLRVKSSLANINEIKLDNAYIISAGSLTATTLNMKGSITRDAVLATLGSSSVGNINMSYDTANKKSNAYIATKQDIDPKAALTVTGELNDVNVLIEPIASFDKDTNKYELYPNGSDKKDRKLITAPKANARNIVARNYRGVGSPLPRIDSEIIAYKDLSNVVYNGEAKDMAVKLEWKKTAGFWNDDSYNNPTYTKSYADAISMINAIGDKTNSYRISFLKTGEDTTKADITTPKGITPAEGSPKEAYSFGNLVWPKANAAQYITIRGYTTANGSLDLEKGYSELRFTGTLKPASTGLKVRFEKIKLTEGAVENRKGTGTDKNGKAVTYNYQVFTPKYEITPDVSAADGVEIHFGSAAYTLSPNAVVLTSEEQAVTAGLLPAEEKYLVFSKIQSSSRYPSNKIALASSAIIRSNSTVQSLDATSTVSIFATAPLTIGDIAVSDQYNLNRGMKIYTAFSDYVAPAAGKPFAGWGNTQLTINGEVTSSKATIIPVEIYPYVDNDGSKYDAKKGTGHDYKRITKDQLAGTAQAGIAKDSGLDVCKLGSYPAFAKLINAKKANADKFKLVANYAIDVYTSTSGANNARLRKNNGALYLSSAEPVVRVERKKTGFSSTTEYETWDMAVTEINNIADTGSHYSITLLKDIGGLGGFNEKSAAFNAGGYAYSDTDRSLQSKPVSTLAMPAKAASVTITSEDPSNPAFIMTTAAKLTPGCDTDFENVGIIRLSAKKNDLYNYAAANYDLVVNGSINVTGLNRCKTFYYKKDGVETPCSDEEAFVSNIGAVTGNNKGVLFLRVDGSVQEAPISIGSVTGIGRLQLDCINDNTVMFIVNGRLAPGELEIASNYSNSVYVHSTQDLNTSRLYMDHNSKLSTAKSMTIGELEAYASDIFAGYEIGDKLPGSFTANDAANADINIGHADVLVRSSGESSVLTAKNVNIKTGLDLAGGTIIAGQGITNAGDGGKITIAELNLYTSYIDNELHVKQDKNGKSQLFVNGAVTDPDGAGTTATVAVHYTDWSNYAKVYNGIQLATLPKAEASFFVPFVNTSGDDMGDDPAYGLTYNTYKSGTALCYGDTSKFEARLISKTHNEDHPLDDAMKKVTGVTDFASLEEALKEIDTLNRRYQVGKTWYYEDYEIQLLKDADIQNAKGDYVAPAMPTAVDSLIIRGDVPDIVFDHEDPQKNKTMKHLTYGGSLTIRSNTMLSDMLLQQKAAKPQALSLGNFHLVLDNVYQDVVEEDDGRIVFKPLEFGAVSGGSQSGRLVLASGNPCDDYGLYTVKAASVSGLHSVELLDDTMMDVAGNYNANRVIFSTENTDSAHVGDAALKVDGNLTVQQIQKAIYLHDPYEDYAPIPVFINAALYLNGTKTNKVNGIKNKAGKFVTLADPSDETTQLAGDGIISICCTDNNPASTAISLKGLDNAVLRSINLRDNQGASHAIYRSGDNILSMASVPRQMSASPVTEEVSANSVSEDQITEEELGSTEGDVNRYNGNRVDLKIHDPEDDNRIVTNTYPMIRSYAYKYATAEDKKLSFTVKNYGDTLGIVTAYDVGQGRESITWVPLWPTEQGEVTVNLPDSLFNKLKQTNQIITLYYYDGDSNEGTIQIPLRYTVGLKGDYLASELVGKIDSDNNYLIGDASITLDTDLDCETNFISSKVSDAILTVEGNKELICGALALNTTINGGTIRTVRTGNYGGYIGNSSNSTVTINGGKIYSAIKSGNITITDGEVYSDADQEWYTVQNVEISGGTVRLKGRIHKYTGDINIKLSGTGAFYSEQPVQDGYLNLTVQDDAQFIVDASESGTDAIRAKTITLADPVKVLEPVNGKINRFHWDYYQYTVRETGEAVKDDIVEKVIIGKEITDPASITTDVTSLAFDELKYGVAHAGKTLTVTNNGAKPYWITGVSSEDFEAAETIRPMLFPGDSVTYTIRPKFGLAEGDHEDDLVINTSDECSASVSCSVTVTHNEATAQFTDHTTESNLSRADVDLFSLRTGYGADEIPRQTVTIKNTGEVALHFNEVVSDHYTVAFKGDNRTLAVGESTTIEVAPNAGLAAGNYDEDLALTTQEEFSLTLSLKFTVKAEELKLSFTGAGGTGDAGNRLNIKMPYDVDAGVYAGTFRIRNEGNSKVKVTDLTISGSTVLDAEKYAIAMADSDTYINPGETADCTFTITEALDTKIMGLMQQMTIQVKTKSLTEETSSVNLYINPVLGLEGSYDVKDFTFAYNVNDADRRYRRYRLLGDTVINIEADDDKAIAGFEQSSAGDASKNLTFTGADEGKLTASCDTNYPILMERADSVLTIQGGQVTTGHIKMDSGSLIVTGGRLKAGDTEVKNFEASGGELDLGDKELVVASGFSASDCSIKASIIYSTGAQYIPNVRFDGAETVNLNLENGLCAAALSIDDKTTLIATSSYPNKPPVRWKNEDINESLQILKPGKGTIKHSEEGYYYLADMEGKVADLVKIGPRPADEKPAFTVNPARIPFEPYVAGKWHDVYGGGENAAVVTVKNTGNTSLTFAKIESPEFLFTIEDYSDFSIEPGEEMNFELYPRYMYYRTPGHYKQDLVIKTDTDATATITAEYDVLQPVDRALVATPTEIDFGTKFKGDYSFTFKPVTVTITNPGDTDRRITASEIPSWDKFEPVGTIPEVGQTIRSGESVSFTICPKQSIENNETITIKLTSDYGEPVEIKATARVKDLSPWKGRIILKEVASVTYNGKAQKVRPEVFYVNESGTPVALGEKDYTLSYKYNTNAAKDTDTKAPLVTVRGRGSYNDAAAVNFTINPVDMTEVYTDADEAVDHGISQAHIVLAETGKDITIAPELKCELDGEVVSLKNGKDYSIAAACKKDGEEFELEKGCVVKASGLYELTVNGMGNYAGSRKLKVYVMPKDNTHVMMSAVTVPAIPNQVYCGKDFIVYGDTTGSRQHILDTKGKEINWAPTYKGKTLVYGTDYTVTYSDNKEIGTATICVYGKGNYAGMVEKTFKITGTDLSKATMTGFKKSIPYRTSRTSEGCKQTEVKFYLNYGKADRYELEKGKDYTETYTDSAGNECADPEPRAVGSYTVTYTGKGAYCGTVKKTYKITGTSIDHAKAQPFQSSNVYKDYYDSEKGGFIYTGDPYEVVGPVDDNSNYCGVNVYIETEGGAKQWVYKGDNGYKVSYVDNVLPGTAKVIFTGTGGYTGSFTKTFRILKREMTAEDISVKFPDDSKVWVDPEHATTDTGDDANVPSVYYAKNGAEPKPQVYWCGTLLREGEDYELAYKSNKDSAAFNAKRTILGFEFDIAPTVIIKGIGNYEGKLERTFTITEAAEALGPDNVEASDIVFRFEPYLYDTNRIVIRDNNGEKLAAGVDYYAKDDKTNGFRYKIVKGSITEIDNDLYRVSNVTNYEINPEAGEIIIDSDSKIQVTIKGKGHYEGQNIVGYYYFVYGDVEDCNVEIEDQYYTGSHIEPAPEDITVWIDLDGNGRMDDGETLQNTEYSVDSTDFDNIDVGYGKLTINGVHDNALGADFSGTRTVKFRILPRTASAP